MRTSNRYRTERFDRALDVYDTGDTRTECLLDLLSDARHWCEANGVSFYALDRKALRFYENERSKDASS